MTDERHNGNPEQTHGRGPSRGALIAKLEEMQAALATASENANENLRTAQRATADLANFRRRVEQDRGELTTLANAVLISKLLAVLDDFDRAMSHVPAGIDESWLDGVRLVERKLRGVLEAEGVTQIEALGQPFDPNLHEAVVHEETADHPDNQVIGELQRGYRLRDRVLRPALVRVANNPAHHATQTSKEH
jgi:molecular chaperone GrpE